VEGAMVSRFWVWQIKEENLAVVPEESSIVSTKPLFLDSKLQNLLFRYSVLGKAIKAFDDNIPY
jgi:hypothetical protein